jgi:hypothetical protein
MKAIKAILLLLFILNTHSYAKEPFMRHSLDNMPVLEALPKGMYGTNTPIEQRGIEFRKFLSASVKIQVSEGAGSGSIIYYDKENNKAYVASCGHLWKSGILSAEQAKDKKIKCKVIVWYKNEVKLQKPESFDAELIFYSYTNETDTSLVTFSPDWHPKYIPLAPADYKYKIGSTAHSCGCDGGKEVAHYEVKLTDINEDVVTIKNSPRPGRSGGGLFDENSYIGTCWGTEFVDGSGTGYFTPIKEIHSFWGKQNGYKFLLSKHLGFKARALPIVNKNSKEEVTQDYILAP